MNAEEKLRAKLADDPGFGEKLFFDDHPEDKRLCVVTDGEDIYGALAKSGLRELLDGEGKFLDLVPYAEIWENSRGRTQSAGGGTDAAELFGALAGELRTKGFRDILARHKMIAAAFFSILCAASLAFGILASRERPPQYEFKDGDFKNYFADAEQKMAALPEYFTKSPDFAELQALDVIERLDKIADREMSPENRGKLAALHARAEKLLAEIRAAKTAKPED